MDISEFSPRSDLSDSHCLLEWVRTFPNSHSITTLTDINESSLVVDVLKELDGELYNSLSPSKLQNSELAWQLSRYLLKYLCKEVMVASSYSVEELVSKLLYICVHSERKQRYIEKILKLDEEVQSILMRMIERIENEVVAVKENRMILDKIADLETGNQELEESLNQNKIGKEELNGLLRETRAEVKRLDDECEEFRKERNEIIRELEIDEFSVFIKVYKKIEQENQEFSNTIKELETQVGKLDEENKNLKQKIIEDGMVISKYHQDTLEMRSSLQKLRSFKRKIPFMSDDSQLEEKESMIGCSYTEIVRELEDHIVTEKEKFSKQIGEYDEQLESMKNENKNLKKTTRFLSSQIGQLQKVYNVMKEQITI